MPSENFFPAAPTNHLKVDPWWDDAAQSLAKSIRGKMNQATLFRIKQPELKILRASLRRHLGGAG